MQLWPLIKKTLKLSSYLLSKFSKVPFTIVLISGISTMVNGTLLNFGKRYETDLRVIFHLKSLSDHSGKIPVLVKNQGTFTLK